MLLEKIKRSKWRFSCDWCQKEFFACKGAALKKRQCCSRSCGSKASRQQVRETLKERYGVINAGQIPEVREKVKTTCLERYGTECSWQSEHTKKAIKNTMVERYGVDHNMRSEILRQNVITTNLERYGVETPFQNKEIRERATQTLIKRFGVDNPQKSKAIRQKTNETCLERYGVKSPLQNEKIRERMRANSLEKFGVEHSFQRTDVKQKIKNTCLERYGVESPMQNPEIQKRMIKNFLLKGKGFVSKLELECFAVLQKLFGEENVFHQIPINGWLIDFHITNIDVYVQFDGVYWHGLNRSQEKLENPVTKRDRDISRKWQRDRDQEMWFLNNKMQLVRILDETFCLMKEMNL